MKRQGDILLVPVERLPDELTEVPREDGKIVLAEGEATDHLHAIEAPEAMFLAEDLDQIEGRFLVVEAEEGVELVGPGLHEVRRQREYTAADGIDVVAD
jgi:hypothetical protein